MSSPWSTSASPNARSSSLHASSAGYDSVDETAQDAEPVDLHERPVRRERLALAQRTAVLRLSFPAHQFPLPEYKVRLLAPELPGAPAAEVRVSPLSSTRELLADQPLAAQLSRRSSRPPRLLLPAGAAGDAVWLDDDAPLWLYDLGEPPAPALLELRHAPLTPSATSTAPLDVVLLSRQAAPRSHRRVHVDAALPCGPLAVQLNARLQLGAPTADLMQQQPHHSLFLFTGEPVADNDSEAWWAGGWWLSPHMPLRHFHVHSMDVLALRPCPLVRLQTPSGAPLDLPLSHTVQQLTEALAVACGAADGPWAVAHEQPVAGGYYDSDSRSSRWLPHAYAWSHAPPRPGDALELSPAAAARYGADPPPEPLARFTVLEVMRPPREASPAGARANLPPSPAPAQPQLQTSEEPAKQRDAATLPLPAPHRDRRLSFSVSDGQPERPPSPAEGERDASQLGLQAGELVLVPASDAVMLPPGEPPLEVPGQLVCTSARIYFVPRDAALAEVRLALHSLSRVERVGLAQLDLETKAPTVLRVRFRGPNGGGLRNRVAEALTSRAWPERLADLFAFQRAGPFEGWDTYVARDEWQRLIARAGPEAQQAWRLSALNHDYSLCRSYPQLLLVPAALADEQLKAVFGFRSKGRVPAVTYLHTTGAALCRSSQPKPGLSRARCPEDERLLEELARQPAGRAPHLALYDVRPRMHAMANTALGAGTENTAHYPFLAVQFVGLQNIHAMRDSLGRLQQVCAQATDWNGEPSTWLSALDRCEWLSHLRLILFGAVQVAQSLHRERTSVLVHCSDGWDRTAQVVALAQLLLDPFYRTLRGFQLLVEKDWLAFGHKFHVRCGHAVANPLDEGRAPIFLQFVDCVWQLQQQFPCAFEFNEALLLELLDALYACHHGTFLCNNEAERAAAQLRTLTPSFWADVQARSGRFANPHYFPAGGSELLVPDTTSAAVRLWTAYYLRHQRRLKEGDVLSAEERAMQLKMTCESLFRQLQDAERELKALRLGGGINKRLSISQPQPSPLTPLSKRP